MGVNTFFKFFLIIFIASVSGAIKIYAAIPSGNQPTGSGTLADPYKISGWENLCWVASNTSCWNKYFSQTADITFPDDILTWDTNKGWSPIGNSSTKFTGNYDGQFYKIVNLKNSRSATNYQGMFGDVGVAGSITRICIENATIAGGSYSGILCGLNEGNISKTYVKGTVTGTNSGTGGICGQNTGTILNCFSIASVYGTAYTGGIVGYNSGTINLCYSSATILNNSVKPGNLVGFNNSSGTISSSVWNSTSYNAGYYSNQGTVDANSLALSSAQLQVSSNFPAGWDFVNIWKISASVNNGFPFFRNIITWNNGSWSKSPGATVDLEIPVAASGIYPTINSATEIANLKIYAGAQMSVANGYSLTITGDVVILGDETSAGQLLANGTVNISGKTIYRKSFEANKWYDISFPYPVNNIYLAGSQTQATLGNFRSPGASNLYITEYNGQKRDLNGTSGANWDAVVTIPLVTGKGYSMIVSTPNTFDFVSADNVNTPYSNSDKSLSATLYATNTSVSNHSWNFLGAPYISAFNVNGIVQDVYCYIYQPSTNNYIVKSPDESYVINPFSAFYIQAATTTLGFNSSGRALKSKSNVVSATSQITLTLSNVNYTDELKFKLNEEGSLDYELNRDALKMYSPVAEVPQIWTNSGRGENLAVNFLPVNIKDATISVKFGTRGVYQIALTNFVNRHQYDKIILIDNFTGIQTDLKSNSYSFDSDAGTFTGRFKIQFENATTTGTGSTDLTSGLKWWLQNGELTLSGLVEPSDIEIFDVTGRLLYCTKSTAGVVNTGIRAKGILVVRIRNNVQNIATKIIL